jgi:hypothetical protein
LLSASFTLGTQAQKAKSTTFDIPSAPLNEALAACARATRAVALIDNANISVYRSRPVRGYLTYEEAWKVMLSDSGFDLQFVGEHAFVIRKLTLGEVKGVPNADAGTARLVEKHAGHVRRSLSAQLCKDGSIAFGAFVALIGLYLTAEGIVRAASFEETTGDPEHDQRPEQALLRVTPEPIALPQPMTIRLSKWQGGTRWPCRSFAGR